MTDSYNQDLLLAFAKGCSVICASEEFDARSKLSLKSETQQNLFERLSKDFSYRLHNGKIISASSVFTFLSETANEFDWIHNPTNFKLSIKHSKNNLTICIKNCLSNKTIPNNIDYIFTTTTGSYREPGVMYISDYDLVKPGLKFDKSSKINYKINYNHLIHYVEFPYTSVSTTTKTLVNNLVNQTQEKLVDLFYNVII